MQNFGATLFLILFAVATIYLYLAVRRGWMRIVPSIVIGCIVNPLLFMMYSLARGNVFLQALLVGGVIGLMITALTISIAAYFRNNPADAATIRREGDH